ncbi:hypothetical protein TRAPUB_13387 [Trametes pubescens]|uniref:Uncharacterized protein n=1 Tax=Trametes pubescens TaxID=154538 RepID=A0A1M2VR85_TRAPU|nr:hypothetical protein TRAPUB_13387 [Trametes pubescens]
MDAVHGIVVAEHNDSVLTHAEQITSIFGNIIVPGRYLVEVLPSLSFLPSWLPGVKFKREPYTLVFTNSWPNRPPGDVNFGSRRLISSLGNFAACRMAPATGNAASTLSGPRVTSSLTAPMPRPLGALPPALSQCGKQYQDTLPESRQFPKGHCPRDPHDPQTSAGP